MTDRMPHYIKPMLAFLVDRPFNGKEWIFEIKWDGYRAISEISKGKILIYSRNLISFNDQFPLIVEALKKIKEDLVLDGEIVILNRAGKSDFQALQNYLNSGEGEGALKYCLFDLLYRDGRDLRNVPLIERKRQLQKIIKEAKTPLLIYSDHIEESAEDFFIKASEKGLEGIIAKERNSPYVSSRSRDWLKIKTHQRQEVVIGGFTAPRGGRKNFGALIIGVYKEGDLKYAGHVGGGFNEKSLQEIYGKLIPLITKNCPFDAKPHTNMPVTWVKPKLVGEVSFQEWTKEGIMRQPIFQGLRIDKDPKAIKREETTKLNCSVKITNREKVYWPKEKYTKGDLLDYYEKVSEFLLPYLKDRPTMIYRFPNGITEEGFFQKNAPSHSPEWVKTFPYFHKERNKTDNYLLIQDLPSLMYTINLGSIELHPFLSRYTSVNFPDYLVLDIDPTELPFESTIEVAKTIHEFLTELKVDHCCKTSGKRGLHIFVPLDAQYNYEHVSEFAKIIAEVLHERMPNKTSLLRMPAKRKKLVYIDYLQNGLTKTVVAPYSVRAIEYAPVSTPLEWSELTKDLDPREFTIKTVPKRLASKGDLFQKYFKKGLNMEAFLKKLSRMRKIVE
jgi:bifunctional non-homologous end joining protein LigD